MKKLIGSLGKKGKSRIKEVIKSGGKMKSYIPTFDWNNGDEIFPFDWFLEDDSLKSIRPRTIKIRRR